MARTAAYERTKEMTEETVTVAEISSFQLETIEKFHPKVSAILNITPDHLNRHHTMDAYIQTKEDIAKNQTAEDTCVLNYEDEETRKFGEKVNAEVLYFSSQHKLEKGIYLENGNIIYNVGEPIVVCSVDELKLLGTHNYENVMAAVAMAAAYGVPMDVIRKTVKEFAGVAHRIEFVCEKYGVAYYNDSKGTNPDAAIKGIQAMNRPTLLIGGGYDKDSEYEEWIESFDGKVKQLVLLGQTKEKIAKTLFLLAAITSLGLYFSIDPISTVILFMILTSIEALYFPILQTIQNDTVTTSRATTLSCYSLVMNIASMFINYTFGYVANSSLTNAYLLSFIFCIIGFILFTVWNFKQQ